MKTRRHAKILELIKAQDIDTQEELLRLSLIHICIEKCCARFFVRE